MANDQASPKYLPTESPPLRRRDRRWPLTREARPCCGLGAFCTLPWGASPMERARMNFLLSFDLGLVSSGVSPRRDSLDFCPAVLARQKSIPKRESVIWDVSVQNFFTFKYSCRNLLRSRGSYHSENQIRKDRAHILEGEERSTRYTRSTELQWFHHHKGSKHLNNFGIFVPPAVVGCVPYLMSQK